MVWVNRFLMGVCAVVQRGAYNFKVCNNMLNVPFYIIFPAEKSVL